MISGVATYIDPVCGMTVEQGAGVTLHWQGRDLRFCEIACRDTFRSDPARWVEPLGHVHALGREMDR
ncbi:MAG: YHS domain-containing protein [Chloroflexi bacterium]|nr:YHS domain-containing protein [Chloroflexota bacterium]